MISLPHDPTRERFEAQALAAGGPIETARDEVARRYGFAGWARLSAYLDVAEIHRRDNDPHVAVETIPDEFCRLACLTYDDDPPQRRAAARELLGVHPELTEDHIWAAAAAADVDEVDRILAADPAIADADGGPYRWKPLHYLTYARHDPGIDEASVLATARLLLDAGADPNAGYLWCGLPTPFTVLTGVFGEGEQGPGRCPRHPHEQALATALLTAGADPNDAQTLYNRMFRPDDSHLALLFAAGLGTGDGGPWARRLAEAAPSPQDLVDGQLDWAVTHGYADRVRLLLSRGADPRRVRRDGRTAVRAAAEAGDRVVVDLLVAAGAEQPALAGPDAFVADCLAGDEAAIERARAGRPGILDEAIAGRPDLIARAVDAGRGAAIPLLAALGFDPNHLRDGESALHRCAWHGDIPTAMLLLDAGADPDLRDERFDGTALDWAEHADQADFIRFIAPLSGSGTRTVG